MKCYQPSALTAIVIHVISLLQLSMVASQLKTSNSSSCEQRNLAGFNINLLSSPGIFPAERADIMDNLRVADEGCAVVKPLGSQVTELNFTDSMLGKVLRIDCNTPEASVNTGCILEGRIKANGTPYLTKLFPRGKTTWYITSTEMKVYPFNFIFRGHSSSAFTTLYLTILPDPLPRERSSDASVSLTEKIVLQSCHVSGCYSDWCSTEHCCLSEQDKPRIGHFLCEYRNTSSVQCNHSIPHNGSNPDLTTYILSVTSASSSKPLNDTVPLRVSYHDITLTMSRQSVYDKGTVMDPQLPIPAWVRSVVISGLPQDQEFIIRLEAFVQLQGCSRNAVNLHRVFNETIQKSPVFCPSAHRGEKAVWSDWTACAPCQTHPQTRQLLTYTCLGYPDWPSNWTQQCSCVNSTQHPTNLTLCPGFTDQTEMPGCVKQVDNTGWLTPVLVSSGLLVAALALAIFVCCWLFRARKRPLAIASCKDQIVTSMGRTVYLTYIYHPSTKNVKAFKSEANKAIVKRMSHECVWQWNVSEIPIVFASEDLVKPYIQLLPQSDKIDRQHLYEYLLACRQAPDAPSDVLVILDHDQDEMGPKCQELFLDDDKHPDIFWLDYEKKRAPGADVINHFTTKLLELQPSDKPTYQMRIQSDYLLTEVKIKHTAVIGNFLVTFHGDKWSVDGQEYHGRLMEFADATLAERLEGLSEEVQGRASMRLRPVDIFLVPVSPGCREAWSQPPALMRCYRKNPERPCITVIIHPKDSCQEVLTCQDIRDLGLSLTIGYEGDTWPPQHSEHAHDLAESIYDATAGFISSNQAQYCISSADISIQDAQSTRLPHEQLPLSCPGDGCHLPPGASVPVPVPAPDDDEEEEDAAAAPAAAAAAAAAVAAAAAADDDDDEAVPNDDDDGEEEADSAADPGQRSVGSGCNSSSATSRTDTHVDTNSELGTSV